MTFSAGVLSDMVSRSEHLSCIPDNCARTGQSAAGARSRRGQAGGAADEGIAGGAAAVAEQGRLKGGPIEARLLRVADLHQDLLCGCQATAWACAASAFP